MIVSDSFVLVRNPKSASQSLFEALIPFGEEYGQNAHHVCVPERKWVIGCVREPVSRAVSGWRYFCRHRGEESLSAYLRRDLDPVLGVPFQWVPQSRWLENCNIILRFENLAADFEKMCERIGVKADLPHINKTEPATADPASVALIRQRFESDFRRFYNAN